MAVVLPLALVAAVSPVMLAEQTALLADGEGRRRSVAYAAGSETVVTLLVALSVLLGVSVALPKLPQLDASLDLALGVVLILLALVSAKWSTRREPRARHTTSSSRLRMNVVDAFAFGAFSMATDVTTLALTAAAAKEIAGANLGALQVAAVSCVLVLTVGLPAWAPTAFAFAAPRRANEVLSKIMGAVQRRERLIVVTLTAAAGLFLTVRGLARIAA